MKLKFLVLVALLGLIACDVRVGSPTEPSTLRGTTTPTPTPLTSLIVINSFTVDNTLVLPNAAITVRWNVSGPVGTVCHIEPNIGDVPTTGFVNLNLVNTTTFTLSCNANGAIPANRILIITVIK